MANWIYIEWFLVMLVNLLIVKLIVQCCSNHHHTCVLISIGYLEGLPAMCTNVPGYPIDISEHLINFLHLLPRETSQQIIWPDGPALHASYCERMHTTMTD